MVIYEILLCDQDGLRGETTDQYIALTDPASVRQIIAALKNEGMVKRNARYTSFSMGQCAVDSTRLLLCKADVPVFELRACEFER